MKHVIAALSILMLSGCSSSGSPEAAAVADDQDTQYPAHVGRWDANNDPSNNQSCGNPAPVTFGGFSILGGTYIFTTNTVELGSSNPPTFTLTSTQLLGSHGHDFDWTLESPTVMTITYYPGCTWKFDKMPNFIPPNADN
jgi:hypothetical protein